MNTKLRSTYLSFKLFGISYESCRISCWLLTLVKDIYFLWNKNIKTTFKFHKGWSKNKNLLSKPTFIAVYLESGSYLISNPITGS